MNKPDDPWEAIWDEIRDPPMYFNWVGEPITMRQWATRFDDENRIVKQSAHQGRRGRVWISTVYLGLDHGFGRGRPLIFESMVFGFRPKGNQVVCPPTISDLAMRRYGTEQEALEGHHRFVMEWG